VTLNDARKLRYGYVIAAVFALAVAGPTLGIIQNKLFRLGFFAFLAFSILPMFAGLALGVLERSGRKARVLPFYEAARLSLMAALGWQVVCLAANFDAVVVARIVYFLLMFLSLQRFSTALTEATLRRGLLAVCVILGLNLLLYRARWNPNSLAMQAALSVTFLYFYFASSRLRLAVPFFGLALLLFLGSRTAILACAMAAIVCFAIVGNLRIILPLVLLVVLAVLWGLSSTELADPDQTLEEVSQSEGALGQFVTKGKGKKFSDDPLNRKVLWENAIQKIKERPLFGVGAGRELDVTGEYRAHNAYFSGALQFGIPGVILYTGFYLFALLACVTHWHRTRHWAVLMTVFLLVYLFTSALTESSGLFSMGAPTNLAAVLLFFYAIKVPVGRMDPGRNSVPVQSSRGSSVGSPA
jgi:O-antigen ligase